MKKAICMCGIMMWGLISAGVSTGAEYHKNPSIVNQMEDVLEQCMRQEVTVYAKKFEGNPYVYGGSSLKHGIDCSGFVQKILKHYGYSLSRTAATQAKEGVRIKKSQLKEGDLLFYSNGKRINHVAMYIGSGKVIHASNSNAYPKGGIKISKAFYRKPVCMKRIIN